MAPIRFVFGLHLHQPIGNFDHVFAQHVEDVYRPLLDRLAGRGFLPVVLHLSGPLLGVAGEPRAGLPGPPRRAGVGREDRDPSGRLLRAGARRAPESGSRGADPLDARGRAAALRGGREGSLADGACLGARARRGPGRRRSALRAGGRPALSRHRFSRRAAPRALLDRERRAARSAVPYRRATPLPDPVPPARGDGRLPARAPLGRAPARGAGR